MSRISASACGQFHAQSALRAVAPLVVGVSILTAGGSLLTTKISLDLSLGAADSDTVRAILTGYPVGFMVGCISGRYLIPCFGHGRTFLAMALSAAVAALGYAITDGSVSWTLLRFVSGIAMATLFTVVESWVNLDSSAQNRGLIISVYMIMTTLGLGAGQAIIGFGTPAGAAAFFIAAAICLAGTLPVFLFSRKRPHRLTEFPSGEDTQSQLSLLQLFKIAPLAVFAAIQTGMTNMNFGVMAPLYAIRTGHDAGTATMLVTLFSIGGLLAQFPVGWFSDRFDRGKLLIALTAITSATALLVTLLGTRSVVLLYTLNFLFGATALSIYPVTMAYVGSRVSVQFLVPASAALLLIHSMGSIMAPALSNELMVRFGPEALFLFFSTISAVVAGCAMLVTAKFTVP